MAMCMNRRINVRGITPLRKKDKKGKQGQAAGYMKGFFLFRATRNAVCKGGLLSSITKCSLL